MEAIVQRIIDNDGVIERTIANHVRINTDDDAQGTTDSPSMNDMLIGQESLWIEGNSHELMRIWRGVKSLCRTIMPEQPGVLAEANFRVFASFLYRWTAEVEEDTSTDDDGEEPTGTAEHSHTQAEPQPPPQ